MKRWGSALLIVLLACIPVFFTRAGDPSLLRDSDTAYLLRQIEQRQDPLSWFAGDWPLGNHFYRPVSTLTFEMDHYLWGEQAAGYGLTNVLIAIGCILALFWFARELTDSTVIATLSALTFIAWHLELGESLAIAAYIAAALALLAGLIKHGLAIRWWWAAPLLFIFLGQELDPLAQLYRGVIGWLPGRTASVMALFALISVASYARYERLSARRDAEPITPLTPPATKGTQVGRRPARFPALWALLSVVSLLLALGSYEQAVMVPALLLATAVTLRLHRYHVRWLWQVPFWLCLVGYLVARSALVSGSVSGYQSQALRFGIGVFTDLAAYILPGATLIPSLVVSLSVGAVILLVLSPWVKITILASNVAAAIKSATLWRWVLPTYLMSILAFLPMAWVNRFEHYHYFPMAFRALFVVFIGWVAFDVFSNAVSPPTRQAPPRRDPAPGSLPRP